MHKTKNQKVAISACLMGEKCKYNGGDNLNASLLQKLEDADLISFCPESESFGTPRPRMDLIFQEDKSIQVICSVTDKNLSSQIESYAYRFFENHKEIELFIGKDRSPSCGVHSAKLHQKDKTLIHNNATGLMAKEAIRRGIKAVDAEIYLKEKL